MLNRPLVQTFSSSTHSHIVTNRLFHITWILLLHLGLIYLLMASKHIAVPVYQENVFRSVMQLVFVRQPSSVHQPISNPRLSSVEQTKPLPKETPRLDATASMQAPDSEQKTSSISTPESLGKSINQADPFALPTDISRLNHVQQRYGVQVLKDQEQEVLTPAQQAARDVRTNSPKLTKSELFAQAAGNLECIYQTRLANGKVIREPGRWLVVPARSEIGQPKNIFDARFCVRLHQNDDADGNDLTNISSGLRGK